MIFSTLLAFGAHVLIQAWEDQIFISYKYLLEDANSKNKFDIVVIFIAGLTALLPVAMAYWVLNIIWHRVPGKKWWIKGLAFSAILLIIKSELIRSPTMGMVMGVPPWLVGVSQLDVWVPNIVLGLILAFGIHKSKGFVDEHSHV